MKKYFFQRAVVAIVLALACSTASAALAADGVIASEPELTVVQKDGVYSVALPGSEYSELDVAGNSASFRIIGRQLPEGRKTLRGGISTVSWAQDGDDTLVSLQFRSKPEYAVISAVPGAEYRPGVEQVIASFSFPPAKGARRGPAMGGREAGAEPASSDPYGDYDMPEMPPVKYSDALVTLNVQNADFREVLWLLSEIGDVSIMLDPYWADEPTGNRRPPGAGADPGNGGGDGSGGPGFRPGGEFNPQAPSQGNGNLSFNFENVPFDRALELVVMAAGLVMVEVN